MRLPVISSYETEIGRILKLLSIKLSIVAKLALQVRGTEIQGSARERDTAPVLASDVR